VGAPFNVLPQGATDVVAPLRERQWYDVQNWRRSWSPIPFYAWTNFKVKRSQRLRSHRLTSS